MSDKKKTLSSLSSLTQDFTFERGDVQLVLQVDIDAMTDTYFREVGKIRVAYAKSRAPVDGPEDPEQPAKNPIAEIWETAALSVEDQKEMRIAQLLCGEEPHKGSLLRGWDAVDEEGKPVALSANTLRELSPNAVKDIWEFCVDQANGVKKT
jgi:hypothetical protein